ncbi:uncharacterized protein L201_000220 [Kwoniella dendrophila CBS 6074]|uniref:Uncharacterized protein n=1 Tax=Kwoniella dendrophila CBS 6074 TaxID=1295534 RepID=A0AAX4JIS8_9TREE
MPVTKKKGTLFAIYADTPERPSSSASSSSASLTSSKIQNIPKSPSKRTSSRKALGSLQPKPIEKPTSTLKSKGLGGDENKNGHNSNKHKPLNEDIKTLSKNKLPSLSSIKSSDLPLKTKSQLSEQPTQSLTSILTKTRTKSSIAVFSDDPPATTSKSELSTINKSTSSTSTSTSNQRKPLSSSIPKVVTSSPKARKLAPPAPILTTSPSGSFKRSRDLLSPLPIIPTSTTTLSSSSSRKNLTVEERSDDPSESPAKRNKLSTHFHVLDESTLASTSTSTPTRRILNRSLDSNFSLGDKENIGSPIVAPINCSPASSVNDSPASRTRSKIRALTLNCTQSPLRGNGNEGISTRNRSNTSGSTRVKVNKVERLVGNGRNTLTLKKGRELSNLITDENTEAQVKKLVGSPLSSKSKKGINDHEIKDIDMLGDVSDAYGANKFDEPQGFKTQRVSSQFTFNVLRFSNE